MPAHPTFAPYRRALVVMPCVPRALRDLQRGRVDFTEWSAPEPNPEFGEALVNAALAALRGRRPELLVVPAPDHIDATLRALALSCLEAARRLGDLACAWPASAADTRGGSEPLTWHIVPAAELATVLSSMALGAHASPNAPHPHEAPAPDATTVSVIVRSMDRLSLGTALDSVILQTHRPIEVVIVNALGAAHRRLPQHCGGLPVVAVADVKGRPLKRADAANRGLDAASGAYMLFLDDDDVLLPNHLIRLVRALQTQPGAPAAYAGVDQGRLLNGDWQPLHRFDADFDPVRLLYENYLPIHGVLLRRAVREAGLRFDENFDLFEDWDFWLQVAALGPLAHVPGTSARYVVSDNDQSGVFSNSERARAARDRLYEKWRHQGSAELHAAALHRLQLLTREVSQARAQLHLLRTDEEALRKVVEAREEELAGLLQLVAARDRDLANAATHTQSLQELITEREREFANAATHAQTLQRLIAERERELANAAAHAESLEQLVAEREREIAAALAHASTLDRILVARDQEIAHALAEIESLRTTLAAKDGEIAAQSRGLQDVRTTLAAQDGEIAAQSRGLQDLAAKVVVLQGELAVLRNEGPLQALKRTLQGRPNGTR